MGSRRKNAAGRASFPGRSFFRLTAKQNKHFGSEILRLLRLIVFPNDGLGSNHKPINPTDAFSSRRSGMGNPETRAAPFLEPPSGLARLTSYQRWRQPR